jgi:ferritin-like metal-binding protein YciE
LEQEQPMIAANSQVLRSLFVTGLQNAHAVEHQALALIDRQLDRLVHYPEVAHRLRLHRGETQFQIERLDLILHSLGAGHSSFKDAAMNLIGNMAAMGNVFAADEVLKDALVNFAFENFEIASYRSLIALAEAGPFPTAATALHTSLEEERAMAAWLEESLPALTLKYVGLRAGRNPASH